MAFGVVTPLHQQVRVVSLIRIFVIVFAVMFLALVYFLAKNNESAPTAVADAGVEVIVPLRSIEAGTLLSREMFAKVSRNTGAVPENSVKEFADIDGHYARAALKERNPIALENLTTEKPSSQISKRIPAGYRAVAIKVDSRSAVEGWALPGAKVDVVWTAEVNDQRTLKVIVENAEVLSAERSVSGAEASGAQGNAIPSTVTLLVSSKDSQKIQYASTIGLLSLSLRGDEDDAKGDVGSKIDLNDMLGIKAEEKSDGVLSVKGKDGRVRKFVMQNGQLKEKFDSAQTISPSFN